MKRLLASFLLVIPIIASAQLGGSAVNSVLDVPSSARVAALGGNQIAVYDNDLNLGIYNPALLNKSMADQVSLSYLDWFSDISLGNVAYARHYDSINTTFSASVFYADFGTFNRTDETGMSLGTFSVGEYAIALSAAQQIDSIFSLGATVKYIFSSYDSYSASGVALDAGGVYMHPNKLLTIAAMLRNIGYQIDSFSEEREKLPFNAQLGLTYKLKHAPFRLGLILENLQKWDLSYDDPNEPAQIDPNTGQAIISTPTVVDKALRHIVVNNEIILSNNFMLRVGYNFRRRAELAVDVKPGSVGLTYGLGIRLKKLHLSYGRGAYHIGGIPNNFTLALRFADFRKDAQ